MQKKHKKEKKKEKYYLNIIASEAEKIKNKFIKYVKKNWEEKRRREKRTYLLVKEKRR